ncbi:MAG: hypothetical protein KJO07_18680, partial [Deltaproteobacteria bacterium]|nr:hypothetical protein [Deltaproteobacteria bacterium]
RALEAYRASGVGKALWHGTARERDPPGRASGWRRHTGHLVGAATTAGGLNLEPGESEAAVVGVPSASFEDWLLVEPGLPESSYLLVILGGAPGPVDPSVGLMPLRAPALCRPMVDAVGRWIAELGPRE